MKLYKFLSLYLVLTLLPIFTFQLFLGHGGEPKTYILYIYYLLASIPFLVPAFIFSMSIEGNKKVKYLWLSFLGLFILLIAIFGVLMMMTEQAGGWALVGFMLLGGAYLIGFLIVNIILTILFKTNESKVTTTLITLAAILVVLVTAQHFGILRPGLFE
ncbi:MAG: hypothetical protein K0S38_634 [Candidatus Paceibacter sp.]|jgi:hypothetical protein|nr:hypothetical protein [Candidatus Paceibacter sp.]